MEIKSLAKTIAEITDTVKNLWERGWAERNAGNISVNVTESLTIDELSIFNAVPTKPAHDTWHTLKDKIIIVTSAGSRMRDLATDPWAHLCLLQFDPSGKKYKQYSEPGLAPTSELPTHLAVHDMLVRTRSHARALVHTHATELIALTQIREFCSTGALNRLLWTMHPETILFVPKGLGFISFELPGTANIADITAKTLEGYPVALWEKHGVLATGITASDAFDTIDLLAKSARIYFMVKSAGHSPEGLTQAQLDKLTS